MVDRLSRLLLLPSQHVRVERPWSEEGPRVPAKQPKCGRLWQADGLILRLRAEYPNHVRANDFVFDRTADGRKLRMRTVVDEYTRQCLAIAWREGSSRRRC